VDEGDPGVPDPRARGLVDQPHAGLLQALERRVEIVRRVRDVVQARPAPGEEAPDRGVGAQRREQLDMALAGAEQDGLDALRRDGLPVHDG
jgi:hypothetical protein